VSSCVSTIGATEVSLGGKAGATVLALGSGNPMVQDMRRYEVTWPVPVRGHPNMWSHSLWNCRTLSFLCIRHNKSKVWQNLLRRALFAPVTSGTRTRDQWLSNPLICVTLATVFISDGNSECSGIRNEHEPNRRTVR